MTSFAEKIIDSMVDENGYCGERGLSEKQFDILAKWLEPGECKHCGGWSGDLGGHIGFTSTDFTGTIGRYSVKLNRYHHFHARNTVVEIKPWIDRLPDWSKSEHQGEVKQRIDLDLTLIRHYWYDRKSYAYGYERINIYTLADADDNCYVWKTTNYLKNEWEDEDGCIESRYAYPGDKVKMRATVKEHNEYKGTKQTVLTRCKVMGIN